jgi:hypothetical protein
VRRRKDPPVGRTLEHATTRLECAAVAALDETIPQPAQHDIVLLREVVDANVVEDISVSAESGCD